MTIRMRPKLKVCFIFPALEVSCFSLSFGSSHNFFIRVGIFVKTGRKHAILSLFLDKQFSTFDVVAEVKKII